MTDLKMVKRCAEAMGYFRPGEVPSPEKFNGVWCSLAEDDPNDDKGIIFFNPLHDDAQAMALVKRFRLAVEPHGAATNLYWAAMTGDYDGDQRGHIAHDADLNRAIVECVAKMEAKP